MILWTGKTYDRLKYLAQIVLPALGTLYFALAGIWGLPSAEQIVGTIVAVDTFLGVCLHLSSNAYEKSDQRFDGTIDVLDQEDGIQNFSMNLPGHADAITEAREIRLKVNKPQPKPRKRAAKKRPAAR